MSPQSANQSAARNNNHKESIEAARRLAAECGITPASRSKNKRGATDNKDDEFADMDI
jgi:phage terminase small subunit